MTWGAVSGRPYHRDQHRAQQDQEGGGGGGSGSGGGDEGDVGDGLEEVIAQSPHRAACGAVDVEVNHPSTPTLSTCIL
jgi:hypothetical protein